MSSKCSIVLQALWRNFFLHAENLQTTSEDAAIDHYALSCALHPFCRRSQRAIFS